MQLLVFFFCPVLPAYMSPFAQNSVNPSVYPSLHPPIRLSVKYFSLSCVRYYQRPNLSLRIYIHKGNGKLCIITNVWCYL